MKRLFVVIAIAGAAAAPRNAQAQQPLEYDRWSITLRAAATHDGPAPRMASTMRREGWDDDHGTGGGTRDFPESSDGGLGLALRIGYRATPRLGAALLVAGDDLGSAQGYRGDDLGLGARVSVDPSVRTVALLGTFHVTGTRGGIAVHLDGGPAVYSASDETGLGALVGAGVVLALGPIAFTFDVQRRLVGDREYGPYEDTAGGGFGAPGTVETFPRSTADWSHTAFAAGIGLQW